MNNDKGGGALGKLINFAEDKGFYIILMLCVIAIGISGYVLFFFPDDDNTAGIGMGEGLSAGIPSGADILPDNMPEIPDVTVRLEQEENPASSDAPTVPEKPAKTPGKAEETWLFSKTPEYLMPVSGEVIRGYSMDTLVYDRTMDDWRTHNGIDIACSDGDSVVAIAGGAVSRVYEDKLLGTVIVIEHDGGYQSVYCGLAANTTMGEGMTVEAGQEIGAAGSTNKTESRLEPHIHLSVLKDGEYVDPAGLKLK